MGLTIFNKVKDCNIELSGGYGMLLDIRREVANLYDREFGKHYEILGSRFMTEEDYKKWNTTANLILNDERFKDEDEDLLDFLFAPDCDGKISYKTCKKVYDLLLKSKATCPLRYAFYSHNDWDDLRKLLLICYKHRANLYWC